VFRKHTAVQDKTCSTRKQIEEYIWQSLHKYSSYSDFVMHWCAWQLLIFGYILERAWVTDFFFYCRLKQQLCLLYTVTRYFLVTELYSPTDMVCIAKLVYASARANAMFLIDIYIYACKPSSLATLSEPTWKLFFCHWLYLQISYYTEVISPLKAWEDHFHANSHTLVRVFMGYISRFRLTVVCPCACLGLGSLQWLQ
jgi:hypothetical protein